MLKPPKTSPSSSGRSEATEEAVATAYVRSRNFAEENKVKLIAAAVGIVVIFLGVLGYFYWQHQQSLQADEQLGAILPVYETGQFQQALEGTAEAEGLLTIADRYGRAASGNLAAFYAANALFQLERYDEAERYFARYSGQDILEASARAGQAAVAEQQGDHGRAARLYEQAASAYPNEATAPEYLMDAARNHEAAGNFDAARRAYQRVQDDFPNAPLATTVPVYLARLDAMAQAR